MSYGDPKRTPRELGAYSEGYRLGQRAWAEAEPVVQEGDPPAELTEDMSWAARDGFWAGWNDAMVEG